MHDKLFEMDGSDDRRLKFCSQNDIPIYHINDMPYEDTKWMENIQQSKMMKRLYFENNYKNLMEQNNAWQGESLFFDINYNLRRKTQKLCANQFKR